MDRFNQVLKHAETVIPTMVEVWAKVDYESALDHAVKMKQRFVPSKIDTAVATTLIASYLFSNTYERVPSRIRFDDVEDFSAFDFWMIYLAVRAAYPLNVAENGFTDKELVAQYAMFLLKRRINNVKIRSLVIGRNAINYVVNFQDMLERTAPLAGPIFSTAVNTVMVLNTGCECAFTNRGVVKIGKTHYQYVVPFDFFNVLYPELLKGNFLAAITKVVSEYASEIITLTEKDAQSRIDPRRPRPVYGITLR